MQTKESMMAVKMTRNQIDGILNGFVTSVQAKHGTNGGLGYAAGFFQSQLAALIAEVPVHKQMEVIQVIVQRSLED
jgi:hypothetical protein